MAHDGEWRADDLGDDPEAGRHSRRSPGKRTLTSLAPDGTSSPRTAPGKVALTSRVYAEPAATAVPYRSEMERMFGTSFSGVRAHLGQPAPLGAHGAVAAARGETVAFAESSPPPSRVAHELTHVVQQRQAGASAAAADRGVSDRGHASEREAEDIAMNVAMFGTAAPPATIRERPEATLSLDQGDPPARKSSVALLPVFARPTGNVIVSVPLATLPSLPELNIGDKTQIQLEVIQRKGTLVTYLHNKASGVGFTSTLKVMKLLNRLSSLVPQEKATAFLKRVSVQGFKVRFEDAGGRIKLTLGRHYSRRSYAFFETDDVVRAILAQSASGLRPTEAHLFVGDKEHGTLARATLYRGKGIRAAQAFDGLGAVIGRPFKVTRPDLHKKIFDDEGEDLWLSVRFGGGMLSIVCAEDRDATTGMVASVNLVALAEKLGKMARGLGAAGKKAATFILEKLRSLASAGASAARRVVKWASGILRFELGSGTEIGWSLGNLLDGLVSSGWNFLSLLPDRFSFGGGSFGAFRMPDLAWLKRPRLGTIPLPGDLISKLLAMLPKGGGGGSGLGGKIADTVKAVVVAVGKGVVGVAVKVADLLGTAAEGAIGFVVDLGKLLAKLGKKAAGLMRRVGGAGARALRRWVHVGKDLILRVYDGRRPGGALVGFDLRHLIDGVQAADLMPVELRLVSGLASIEGQREIDADADGPKSRDRVKVKRPRGKALTAGVRLGAPEWLQRALVTTDQIIHVDVFGGGRRALKFYIHTPGHGDDKGDEGGLVLTINARRLTSSLGKRLKLSGKLRKRFKISADGARIRIDWVGRGTGENYVVYNIADFIGEPNFEPSMLVPVEIQISGDGYSLRGGSQLALGDKLAYGYSLDRLKNYWYAAKVAVPGFIADQIGVPTAHVYLDRGGGAYPRGVFLSGRKLSIKRPKYDPNKPFDTSGPDNFSRYQQYTPGVELRVEEKVLARVEKKAKKQLGRAGGVAKRIGRTVSKALGSRGKMPNWSVKPEIGDEGLKFSAGAGNWVLFDWGTIIGLITGQVAWSSVRPHAFSIATGDAVLSMGPLDHKNLPPATPDSIEDDKFTVQIGELPGPIKSVTKAFGYSDSHYIRIDPEASQVLDGDSPRADITADVFVVENGRPKGVRIRFAVALEPILRAFLPKHTVDRILRGGGKNKRGGTGFKVGLEGLVVTVEKSIGRGKRKKQLGASFKWNLGTLLEILLNFEDVREEPSMLLPDALGGFLSGATKGGHEFRLEFSAKQRVIGKPGDSPGGTRVDAQLLGMVDSLGMVVPPELARRARLYISIPGGLTAAKKIAQTLVSGDLVEMAAVKLMIVGKKEDDPASIYELSLWVDAAVARMIGKFIPYLGLAIKLYESGKDILSDPKGTLESILYTPEALKHIFSGSAGEALGDVLYELSPEEAALLMMLDNTSMKQKVKAARAYERIKDAVGSPDKKRIMASAGMSPKKLEKLSEYYAKLSDAEVEALGKLVKASEKYNIPLGDDDDFDPSDLQLALDNYEEQIAVYEEAHKAGIKLMKAKEGGASEKKLMDMAKKEEARIEAALDARRKQRGDSKPAPSDADPDQDLAGAPKHDPNADRDIHALPPPSQKARDVEEKIFASDPKGSVPESERQRLMRKYGGLDEGELAQLLDDEKIEKDGVIVEMPASEEWFVRQLLLHLMDPKRDPDNEGDATSKGVVAEYNRRKAKEVAKKTGLGRKRVENAAKKNAAGAKKGDFEPGDYSSHEPGSPDFVEDVVEYQKKNGLPRTGVVDKRTQKKQADKVASGEASRDAMNEGHADDTRADDAAKPKPTPGGASDKDFDPFETRILQVSADQIKRSFEVTGDELALTDTARKGEVDATGRVVTPGIEHLRQEQKLPNGYRASLHDYKVLTKAIPNQARAWRVRMAFLFQVSRNGKPLRKKVERMQFVYVAGKSGKPEDAKLFREYTYDRGSIAKTLVRSGTSLSARKGAEAQLGGAKVSVKHARGTITKNAQLARVRFSLRVLGGKETLLDDATNRKVTLTPAPSAVEISLDIPVSLIPE